MNFEIIRKMYYNARIINIYNYLDDISLNVLRKMGIFIEKDRLYTPYEFDTYDGEVYEYYNDPVEFEMHARKKLSDINVSRKDYRILLKVFGQIADEYSEILRYPFIPEK